MSDEDAFLRAILAKPEDAFRRLIYADWLEERGDPRAPMLRMEPDLERIGAVARLEGAGSLDDSLEHISRVKGEAVRRHPKVERREQRRVLSRDLDPDWVAFINAMGCPFRPFFLCDGGEPREGQADDLPFANRLGTRGPVVTFESDFRDERDWDPGLMRDLGFLARLELGECAYGAGSCPVHPFLCQSRTDRRPLTGSGVLASLRAHAFQSRHIRDLEATNIPYPGYHPGDGQGHYNDEIHNDFQEQYVFKHDDHDEDGEAEVDESSGTHGMLKRYVDGGRLWYVLLHTTPQPFNEFLISRFAVLLAVGRSPDADRLLGVITHQVCHNLCD